MVQPRGMGVLRKFPVFFGLFAEFFERKCKMANTSILLLIATGIIIFCYDKNYTFLLDLENRWNVVIGL